MSSSEAAVGSSNWCCTSEDVNALAICLLAIPSALGSDAVKISNHHGRALIFHYICSAVRAFLSRSQFTMGREIQKKKNRSGLQKIRQRPKSKKKVLQHPIIAANWDTSQTLTQNYRRLGLTAKLNKQTGGTEKKASDMAHLHEDTQSGQNLNKGDDLHISRARRSEQINLGEARVERDPQTGKIVRLLQDDSSTRKPNPLNDPLNDLASESDDERRSWSRLAYQYGNSHQVSLPGSNPAGNGSKTDVVAQLEHRAQMPAAKYKRRQTENEQAFIEELVHKYGEDYGKMARDMKLNYMQRSKGDLKRRVSIWKGNGGAVG